VASGPSAVIEGASVDSNCPAVCEMCIRMDTSVIHSGYDGLVTGAACVVFMQETISVIKYNDSYLFL